MSSNIKVKRICQHCSKEFMAKTTVTKYCGEVCAKRAYKAKKRAEKYQDAIKEVQQVKAETIEALNSKEILTIKEVAQLIACSTKTVYRLINKGSLSSQNLGQRLTRVQRKEVNKLLQIKTVARLEEKEKQSSIFSFFIKCYGKACIW